MMNLRSVFETAKRKERPGSDAKQQRRRRGDFPHLSDRESGKASQAPVDSGGVLQIGGGFRDEGTGIENQIEQRVSGQGFARNRHPAPGGKPQWPSVRPARKAQPLHSKALGELLFRVFKGNRFTLSNLALRSADLGQSILLVGRVVPSILAVSAGQEFQVASGRREFFFRQVLNKAV